MTTKVTTPNYKYIKSNDEFNVYSNHTGISISSFDIRIILGQLSSDMATQIPEGGSSLEVPVSLLGTVIMAPAHAKLVCENLRQNIEMFEKMFGTINLPPHGPAVK